MIHLEALMVETDTASACMSADAYKLLDAPGFSAAKLPSGSVIFQLIFEENTSQNAIFHRCAFCALTLCDSNICYAIECHNAAL